MGSLSTTFLLCCIPLVLQSTSLTLFGLHYQRLLGWPPIGRLLVHFHSYFGAVFLDFGAIMLDYVENDVSLRVIRGRNPDEDNKHSLLFRVQPKASQTLWK